MQVLVCTERFCISYIFTNIYKICDEKYEGWATTIFQVFQIVFFLFYFFFYFLFYFSRYGVLATCLSRQASTTRQTSFPKTNIAIWLLGIIRLTHICTTHTVPPQIPRMFSFPFLLSSPFMQEKFKFFLNIYFYLPQLCEFSIYILLHKFLFLFAVKYICFWLVNVMQFFFEPVFLLFYDVNWS